MTLADDLQRTWIPHLQGQFERGRPILFTGAGFSLAAKALGSRQVLSYTELKKELWKLCFPESEFDESSSLQDLYEHAVIRHRKPLTDLLLKSFSIDADSLPEWYQPFFSLPWQRAYTLNIDDLDAAANTRFDLPRRIVPISATQINAAVDLSAGNRYDFVHLNGSLKDVPEGVTFSVTQYAERAAVDPWYIRFTADLVTSPVVFIGTRLEEPPLWQHLVLRHGKGGREFAELRHRSYLVTPTLDRAKQALLAQFNIVWLPMDAETFSKTVLTSMDAVATAGLAAIHANKDVGATKAEIQDVTELASVPTRHSEFLQGSEPIWADIQMARAIEREVDTTLWDVTSARIRDVSSRVLVITGTAGSGKSTSLKRLCLRLANEGIKVGWIDRETDIAPGQIRGQMRTADAPRVLAIEDADMYGSELARLTRDLSQGDEPVFLIIATRSGKVDRILNPAILEGVALEEISMPHLQDSDITKLIALLEREKRLGILTGKTKSDQIAAFRDEAGRQLLVAMIKATLGQELQDKAYEEFSDLTTEAQQIYSVIVLASSYRFGLTREEILIASKDTTNKTLNALQNLVQRHIITLSESGFYGARHRVIADLVRDNLQRRGQLQHAVSGLALLSATKVNPGVHRSARPWRMLKVFINHDFLHRSCGSDFAQNLYGSLEDLLHWDYHFWLQRGSLELEFGDLRLAEQFLSSAKSLGDLDPIVETEWAYLLMKKAILIGGVDAPLLVEQATTTLEELMGRVGDPYPYHVLGSQGLAWARRGISSQIEKERYLRELIQKLGEGCKRYPHEGDLKQLLEDVKREYLGIAVSKRLV